MYVLLLCGMFCGVQGGGVVFLVVPCGLQDLSSLTKDSNWTMAVKTGNPNYQNLQGILWGC